ncbi:hypothetical protein GGF32_000390 [Allomyces javanicus]|nr:hypothetical protein GGF32_000390 [Allomyces javanicus]
MSTSKLTAGAAQRNFTKAELAQFDNSDESKPVYLAIKGVVFDVSSNRSMYPHGSGYGVFAGKDASRALAKSSLDEEHCVPQWKDLPADELKVLNDWFAFYEKKYPIVGRVNDGSSELAD